MNVQELIDIVGLLEDREEDSNPYKFTRSSDRWLLLLE